MTTLTVFKFSTVKGAQQLEDLLLDLQQQQRIEVQDAALVTWPQGKQKPKTRQLYSLAGQGALASEFWGTLFGLIFFVPFLDLAAGAVISVRSGRFSDYGVDDNFIKQTRATVTEGTSALFVLTNGAVQDKVVAALQGQTFEIIAVNLPKGQADELRAVFGTAQDEV